MIETPFIHLVPDDVIGNLKFRAKIHRRVIKEPGFAEVLWDACAVDPLFYICTFGYAHEARGDLFKKLPFILYPFQREGLLEILDAINHHDLLIKKSRDMGASWMCILAFEWMWHFSPRLQAPDFLMGSRVQEYVDSSKNPKSLFWKLDYFHDNLPPWLMPPGYDRKKHRQENRMINPWNGAIINGESTTKQFARGDRRTAILLDEFAAVDQGHGILPACRDATRSRIFNSTPLGINNAYYDVHETKIKKLQFHWRDHPTKSLGLYTTDENGKLKILRKEGYPKGYTPILDGDLRSPAFDYEESRSSPREMAQEWNIDFMGSGQQFFSADAIQDATRKFARPPVAIGDIDYDTTTADPTEFREREGGHIHLWRLLNRDGNILSDCRFVLGIDVSAGTGASNSTMSAYDVVTNEKVLEYVNPYIRPEEFAKQAVAVARWLNKALMLWEAPGPGRQFGSRVGELGYGNVYLDKKEEAISKKVTMIPGWKPTKEKKLDLIGEYRSAIEGSRCVNRSKEALLECLEYVYNPEGGVSHARENNKEDTSGAKSNHGDRVIADALAWRGISERRTVPEKREVIIPVGSLAWRMEMRKKDNVRPNRELSAKEGW